MPAWGIARTTDDVWSMYVTERYRTDENRLRRYAIRPYGFGSISADEEGGWLETEPLLFEGEDLVLNFTTGPSGHIAVELRDEDGSPLPGFTLADMIPLSGNALAEPVIWTSGASLSQFHGQLVRLYFELVDADLFALQFAPQILAADFDDDGDVDGNDFLTWQAAFGTQCGIGCQAEGDADGDGDTDGNDFLIWQQEFGSVLDGQAGNTVPEPNPVFLALLFLLRQKRPLGSFW